MTRLSFYGTLLLALGVAAGPACSASESDMGLQGGTGGSSQTCVPGQKVVCPCPGDAEGEQVCLDDGSAFGQCQCEPGGGGSGGTEPCGDYWCNEDDDESCHTCPKDCGICAPCDIAPKCENVTLPPQDVPHFTGLDVTMEAVPPPAVRQYARELVQGGAPAMRIIAAGLDPQQRAGEHPFVTRLRELFAEHPEGAAAVRRQLAQAGMESVELYRTTFPEQRQQEGETLMDVVPGGTVECGAPFLRFAIVQLTVHEDYDDVTDDVVYCVVTSEPTSGGGEILITPPTQSLDEGESFTGFTMSNAVFWGQTPAAGCEDDVFVCGPRTPGGDLMITYDCLEQDDPTVYVNLINGIGQAAGAIGGFIPGTAGWILIGIGAVAPIISGLIGADGDDYLFHAQHIVELEDQLELTNGWYYSVRKSGSEGTVFTSDWDWELFIKVWGCAEYGEL